MPRKSFMHHDIQKIISYHNFYLFFRICKWKEFKLFQLLESFKKNVPMHHPSIKQSLGKQTRCLHIRFYLNYINSWFFMWRPLWYDHLVMSTAWWDFFVLNYRSITFWIKGRQDNRQQENDGLISLRSWRAGWKWVVLIFNIWF